MRALNMIVAVLLLLLCAACGEGMGTTPPSVQASGPNLILQAQDVLFRVPSLVPVSDDGGAGAFGSLLADGAGGAIQRAQARV